ncbi:hypothetical protein [Egicoccus sp. AB-alg2]|uniref:hypothetical protein n=1 Tax=Egicoccus sp. AB-alg2 TaxID=3242693 RepID=UPI00359EAD46
MLGREIGHEIGQQTGVRVLPDPQHGIVMEVSVHAEGSLLGTHYDDHTTYRSWEEADGTIRGSGHGIVAGEDGEQATWEGMGAGTRQGDGSVQFRGALFYRSRTPRFSEINGRCCVFEYDVDPGGKSEGRFWLWE